MQRRRESWPAPFPQLQAPWWAYKFLHPCLVLITSFLCQHVRPRGPWVRQNHPALSYCAPWVLEIPFILSYALLFPLHLLFTFPPSWICTHGHLWHSCSQHKISLWCWPLAFHSILWQIGDCWRRSHACWLHPALCLHRWIQRPPIRQHHPLMALQLLLPYLINLLLKIFVLLDLLIKLYPSINTFLFILLKLTLIPSSK